jgi:hypothetical protein
VTDANRLSIISRYSIAAAVFGALCNLLSWAILNYQGYLEYGWTWSVWAVVVECVCLAPMLVLFIFRQYAIVVFPYAIMLLLNLIARVNYDPKRFVKIDAPGVFLMLLGGLSVTIFFVWAMIRWVIFIRGAPRSGRSR